MRQYPTASERRLGQALSGSKLGVAFRSQVPVGRFIVDFLAPSVRLIVEVDGGVHLVRRSADAARERKLRRAGYRVLRVTAEEVMRELPKVLECIRETLHG
jgi:very-short-patch-repair endonuclease